MDLPLSHWQRADSVSERYHRDMLRGGAVDVRVTCRDLSAQDAGAMACTEHMVAAAFQIGRDGLSGLPWLPFRHEANVRPVALPRPDSTLCRLRGVRTDCCWTPRICHMTCCGLSLALSRRCRPRSSCARPFSHSRL